MKVVFMPGHEKMRDGLIGKNSTLARIDREQGTVLRIQEDIMASQQKVYKDAWEEAEWRNSLEKSEEWTLVGPKSKPRLLPNRNLEEGKRMSKKEKEWTSRKNLPRSLKRLCRTTWYRRWQQGHIIWKNSKHLNLQSLVAY
jgi:hypothetical protein